MPVIENNEMSVEARFENVWFQIKQLRIIFTHLKLWVAVATHNFKWVKMYVRSISPKKTR